MDHLRTVLAVTLGLNMACGGDDGGVNIDPGDNLAGEVTNERGGVGGATITILDTGDSVLTDERGRFSLSAPTGAIDYLVTADGHWGQIFRFELFDGQMRSDVEVELATDAEVAEVETALGRSVSPSSGVVVAEFFTSDAVDLAGGSIQILEEGTPVGTDPPFTFDGDDEPVESSVVLSGIDGPELIFTGVPAGDYEISPVQTETLACSSEFDTVGKPLPVRARTVTSARIFCARAN